MDELRFPGRSPFHPSGVDEVEPYEPIDLGDVILPPPPPEEGGGSPRRPRRTPPQPGRPSPGLGIIVALLLIASGALQVLILSMGARGGTAAVYAVSIATAVLFLGPFYVGAIWFGRQRDAERTRG